MTNPKTGHAAGQRYMGTPRGATRCAIDETARIV